jgi:ornithine cyclodeaminase
MRAADFRSAVDQADVLLTVTPAADPFVRSGWMRAGTHINAMGADTAGKGEIEPELLARARVFFFDDWQQACTIGECRRAVAIGLLTREAAGGAIGDVLRNTVRGRRSDDEITLFDSSGVDLQDIAIAVAALANSGHSRSS